MSAPHDAAIQAQRAVQPMSDARLREVRPYLKGPMGREVLAEVDRLRRTAPSEDSIALDMQLSINQKLMDRLDVLEAKVKELQHRQAV